MGFIPVGAYIPPQLRISDNQYAGMSNLASKALDKFLDFNLCNIAGKFEAGYRKLNLLPLAGLVMAGRRFAGCSPNLPDDLRKLPPPPPFEGGQCPVDYKVTVQGTTSTGSPVSQTRQPIRGPIKELTWGTRPDGYWWLYAIDGNNNVREWRLNGISTNYGGYLLQRTDGQPDNCGDPDSGEPVYPPPIDLPPQPWPDPGDTIFNQTTVDVDIDVGGVNVQVSVEVGDITFDIAGLKFNVGDVDIRLSPDFRISVGDGNSDQQDYDDLKTDINGIGQDIDKVKQDLEKQYSGSVSWVDCEGNTFSEGYSGEGLNGVIAAIKAQNSVNNQGDTTVCPVDEPPPTSVSPVLLRRQTYDLNNETGFPTTVPANARFIEVVIESGNIDQYLYKGIAPDSKQGRFGLFFWGWGDPTDIRWSAPEHIYFEKTVHRIPSDLNGTLYYRISSHAGFTIASYDSGIR